MAGLNAGLRVPKTIKFFINGEFVRTESGRSLPVYQAGSKKLYAHLGRGSRKDLRNAVEAARGAQAGWARRSAYNRSQILYRAAEMMEGKRSEFVELLRETQGYAPSRADQAVSEGIDALVYYAGWADKYPQAVGSVNPVNGPHHSFTTPEALGVVGLIPSAEAGPGELLAQLGAITCSGNAVVAVLSGPQAALVGPLAEVLATSDFPKGVINLLSGKPSELLPQVASHMELDGVAYGGEDPSILTNLQREGAANMKRIASRPASALALENILSFVEYKTVWHPVGF
jgi:acyl-CoA reductase-like NAD-dependent aldehyde dehydrogenase